jgi:hypothetical protein
MQEKEEAVHTFLTGGRGLTRRPGGNELIAAVRHP